MLHVVMVKVGDKYGPDYVAILSDMLARNLSEVDAVCWCVTDQPETVPDGINTIPHNPDLPGWWQKVWLFSPDMPWSEGDRIAYFDLDSVVTGRLEPLVETKGIIKDWNWPGFNSSVMVWDHGEHRQIWSDFDPAIIDRPSQALKGLLPKGQINGGDQEWIYAAAPDFPTLPEGWCVSYRQSAVERPPYGSKVVCFHGNPKPDKVTEGWVPDFWKMGGFTPLPKMDGANVTDLIIRANIRSAIQRDLPWFTGYHPHGQPVVICCGGPSLADNISAIRLHKKRGARIVTVNNSWRFLMERGIKPDSHVLLDARPENAAFVKDAPEGVRYLVASQCDPSVFDALKDREVVVWHNMAPGLESVFEPLLEDMMLRRPGAKPLFPVPGGGTVGLRAINLAWMGGYQKIHVYGLDGSFREDAHHAYAQSLNDDDAVLEVQLGVGGKRYKCARWMVRQAEEFRDTHELVTNKGLSLYVHGDGLIPDLARSLRRSIAA